MGDHLRISILLANVGTGVHVWAERYDQPRHGYRESDDDLSAKIAVEIAARVIDDSAAASRGRPPSGLRACDLFVQGLRISDRFTPADQERARQLFDRARALDPTFACAYTGLAFNYLHRDCWWRLSLPVRGNPNMVEALRWAELAHSHEPSDPRVQYTLGFACLVRRQFDRARRHLTLAQAMNPNDPDTQSVCAYVFACLGDPKAGAAAAERVLQLNPRYPPLYGHYLSRVAFVARRYSDALPFLERSTNEAPLDHPRDSAYLAAAYAQIGRYKDARRYAEFFLASVQRRWLGKPSDGPSEYVEWLIQASYLQRADDIEHLRAGLRMAGLPA
jgi:tetratricopeptide (TPR) repeat protein